MIRNSCVVSGTKDVANANVSTGSVRVKSVTASEGLFRGISCFLGCFLFGLLVFWVCLLVFSVKEKETPAPEVNEDEVEENTKRHLNVVFIGHVGKIKLPLWTLLIWLLKMLTLFYWPWEIVLLPFMLVLFCLCHFYWWYYAAVLVTA